MDWNGPSAGLITRNKGVRLSHPLLLFALLVGLGCAGPAAAPARAPQTRPPGWVLWQMGMAKGEAWYKPLTAATSSPECLAAVKARSGRWRVGHIGWYPDEADLSKFSGCLPEGYDPYEGK